MKEYIERAEVYQYLDNEVEWNVNQDRLYALEVISDFPTADVSEVRHGRWEFLGPNRLIKNCMCGTCSACHVRSKYIANTAICPNCGALMREDEHETS